MRTKDVQTVVSLLGHSLDTAPDDDVPGLLTAIGTVLSHVRLVHPDIDVRPIVMSLPAGGHLSPAASKGIRDLIDHYATTTALRG